MKGKDKMIVTEKWGQEMVDFNAMANLLAFRFILYSVEYSNNTEATILGMLIKKIVFIFFPLY